MRTKPDEADETAEAYKVESSAMNKDKVTTHEWRDKVDRSHVTEKSLKNDIFEILYKHRESWY